MDSSIVPPPEKLSDYYGKKHQFHQVVDNFFCLGLDYNRSPKGNMWSAIPIALSDLESVRAELERTNFREGSFQA